MSGGSAPQSVADLAIGGDELLAMGLRGRQVGATLERLLALVLDRPSRNRKKTLLNLAHRLSTASDQDMDPDR